MNIIRDIINSTWMLHANEAEGLRPLFNSLISGEQVDLSMHAVVSSMTAYSSGDQNKTKKQVLVIPISGVIMKYDYCGDMGMMTFESILKQCKDDDNIGAVVLDIDSGGGQATYLDHVATAMRELRDVKPVLVHVHGLCASAAYYIASQATKIYVSSMLDEVGSIGTMCGLTRNNENSTAQYTVEYFYASASVNKNEAYRDAQNGKPDKMIENLDKYNNEFLSNVKTGRPTISPEALTGVCVYADRAMELNLIDGIKRLDQVIAEAFSLIK